jgi:hypothetical protein
MVDWGKLCGRLFLNCPFWPELLCVAMFGVLADIGDRIIY